MEQMVYLIPALIVVAIAGTLLKLLKLKPARSTGTKTAPPEALAIMPVYTSRKTLLTKAETQAFRMLHRKLQGTGYLCPKVRISDLISVQTPDAPRQRLKALSKLSQKHVDFAVMSASGSILFAIEVDDASHRAPKTMKRDQFVNDVFRQAGIPLFRGDLGELETHTELAKMIEALLDQREQRRSA